MIVIFEKTLTRKKSSTSTGMDPSALAQSPSTLGGHQLQPGRFCHYGLHRHVAPTVPDDTSEPASAIICTSEFCKSHQHQGSWPVTPSCPDGTAAPRFFQLNLQLVASRGWPSWVVTACAGLRTSWATHGWYPVAPRGTRCYPHWLMKNQQARGTNKCQYPAW